MQEQNPNTIWYPEEDSDNMDYFYELRDALDQVYHFAKQFVGDRLVNDFNNEDLRETFEGYLEEDEEV